MDEVQTNSGTRVPTQYIQQFSYLGRENLKQLNREN